LRNARRPEFRSGIFSSVSHFRDLADQPLRRHPEELVGAFLGRAGADDLVDRRVLVQHLTNSGMRSFG